MDGVTESHVIWTKGAAKNEQACLQLADGSLRPLTEEECEHLWGPWVWARSAGGFYNFPNNRLLMNGTRTPICPAWWLESVGVSTLDLPLIAGINTFNKRRIPYINEVLYFFNFAAVPTDLDMTETDFPPPPVINAQGKLPVREG